MSEPVLILLNSWGHFLLSCLLLLCWGANWNNHAAGRDRPVQSASSDGRSRHLYYITVPVQESHRPLWKRTALAKRILYYTNLATFYRCLYGDLKTTWYGVFLLTNRGRWFESSSDNFLGSKRRSQIYHLVEFKAFLI